VPDVHKLYDDFQSKFDFVGVYVMEAHAADEWPIRSSRYHNHVPVSINQHKTVEERKAAARAFQQTYSYRIPVVVDSMSNAFTDVYAAWPLRYIVIDPPSGKLLFKSQPVNAAYHLDHLRRFLETLLEKRSKQTPAA